jgi:hypothetical protein
MKTHEHALISLGYGAIMAAMAGNGLLDPGIYVAALIGGELIDFIDHPLYQLLFARNDRTVAEARVHFKKEGFRAGIRYLLKKEDERSFNKLRLHNAFSLTLITYTTILASLFLPGPVYSFVLLGAFLLHMMSDIYGDFRLLGHFDNWLWILNKQTLDWLARRGRKLVWIVLLWWVNILLGFFLVSLRSTWQLYRPSTYAGLASEARNFFPAINPSIVLNAATSNISSGEIWLAYGPLLFLLVYFSAMFMLILAGAHKFNLETPPDRRGNRRRFSTGSLHVIRDFLGGRLSPDQRRFEKILLAIQSDQAIWIIILTLLIAAILMLETCLKLINPTVLILTPMVFALIFGTLFHTTIGEFGGVQGVLLATFLNLVLSNPLLHLQPRWPVKYGYLLFAAACGAWLLGLIGGIVLREHKCMSLITFVFRLRSDDAMDHDMWLHDVMDIARHGLEEGYQQAHRTLFGENKHFHITRPQIDTLITAQSGKPTIPGDFSKLTITDQTAPLLQDITYILCGNRLISQSKQLGDFGLLPTLPRSRVIVDDPRKADLVWKQNAYFWDRAEKSICIPNVDNANGWLQKDSHLGIVKTWGEFFDDLVCRQWLFRTDLYIYPTPDDPCSITFCGLSRTSTSTKEYATVESEIYVKAVFENILRIASSIPGVHQLENQTARVLYPRLSFDDWQITEEISKWAIFSSKVNSCFSKEAADLVVKSLGQIPSGNKIAGVAAGFGKRLLVLAGQLGIAYFVSTLGFDWLAEIIKSF